MNPTMETTMRARDTGRDPGTPVEGGRHTVNHDEAIEIILERILRGPTAPNPPLQTQRVAEEHVTHCSDCWSELGLLNEIVGGTPAPDAAHVAGLYGCEPVQKRLYLLPGLDPTEARHRYPDIARHVGSCHACRERLAELIRVERAAAQGAFGHVTATPARMSWRTVTSVGEQVLELLGQTVIRI